MNSTRKGEFTKRLPVLPVNINFILPQKWQKDADHHIVQRCPAIAAGFFSKKWPVIKITGLAYL